MADDKERPFWQTVVKLAAGAIALILFFGLGLYYSAKFDTYAPPSAPPEPDWGIVTDSPVRSRR